VKLVDIELHLEADLLVRVRQLDDEAVEAEQTVEQQVMVADHSDRCRGVFSALGRYVRRRHGEKRRGKEGGVTLDLGEEMLDSAELSETWAPWCWRTTTEMEVCMSFTAERLWQLRQVPKVTMTCLREMMRENFVREFSIASLPTCRGGERTGGEEGEGPRACEWSGRPRGELARSSGGCFPVYGQATAGRGRAPCRQSSGDSHLGWSSWAT
jgi:hypothetical protein